MTKIIDRDPIQGLIDYILDIKPYHSKIAEVSTDFVINDDVNVTILDSNAFDGEITQNRDALYACDEGFGVAPYGEEDQSISYIPDLGTKGIITPVDDGLAYPILFIDPFTTSFFVEEDKTLVFPPSIVYTITAVITGVNGTWKITGNHATSFTTGQTFIVSNNTGDGEDVYTVLSATNNGANTDIVVNETILVNASGDGNITTGIFLLQESYANNGYWQIISSEYQIGSPPNFVKIFEYEQATIINGDQGLQEFWILGDQTLKFTTGFAFTIFGSSGNDGTYEVASVLFDGFNSTTKITTVEPIPSSTFDGILAWRENGDILKSYTQVTAQFISAFPISFTIIDVPSLVSPFTFKISNDFTNQYDNGDSFTIINSTQSYNNSSWIITSEAAPNSSIIAVNTTLKKFTITGNLVSDFNTPGEFLYVIGSIDSTYGSIANRAWEIISASPNGPNTDVFVKVPFGSIFIDPDINKGSLKANYAYVIGTHVFENTTDGNIIIPPSGPPTLTLTIFRVNVPASQFIVVGNYTASFPATTLFKIDGTNGNGNQGKWQVVASSYDAINNLTRITSNFVEIFPNPSIFDGQIDAIYRSNWDLPELCINASQTTISGFIDEDLQFIYGSSIRFYDTIFIPPVGDSYIPWGGDDYAWDNNGWEADQLPLEDTQDGIITPNERGGMFIDSWDMPYYDIDAYDARLAQLAQHYGSSYPPQQFSIVSANSTTDVFVVADDKTTIFTPGRAFGVNGTSANDGTYFTVSSTYNAGQTTIQVASVSVTQGATGIIIASITYRP